jgi:hypothetical protein
MTMCCVANFTINLIAYVILVIDSPQSYCISFGMCAHIWRKPASMLFVATMIILALALLGHNVSYYKKNCSMLVEVLVSRSPIPSLLHRGILIGMSNHSAEVNNYQYTIMTEYILQCSHLSPPKVVYWSKCHVSYLNPKIRPAKGDICDYFSAIAVICNSAWRMTERT